MLNNFDGQSTGESCNFSCVKINSIEHMSQVEFEFVKEVAEEEAEEKKIAATDILLLF